MRQERQNSATFLPDFCNARTVFVVILLAELLAIVLTLAQPSYVDDRLYNLAMYSLFIEWVALSCTAVLCVSRRWLQQFSDHGAATISYVTTLLVTLVITELAWWVFNRETGYNFFRQGHTSFLLPILGISAIVWAMALRYFYVQHQWRIRVASESEARFQALQSRIKPHFLFNCMNTIASLIRRNPALAEEVVEDLSDLFRASLQDSQRPSTLGDEIALCERYLRIEQQRLGPRLNAVWQLAELPLDTPLPALSIQPLLENAIYHGIEPLPEGGTISILGGLGDEGIRIIIENPLSQAASKSPARTGNRIAQENVRQRLGSFFSQDDLLQVSQDEQSYRVSVTIPLQR